MFLITTADQRFWKTDKPVLFLGEWCKVYSQKALWQKMQQEVLAYHWDDRRKLLADYQYLQGLYEKVLADLARCLNSIHGEERPLRYWRLIIGPWLFFFIQVFYDRYTCIQKAAQSAKVTDAVISPSVPNQWVPKDYADFSAWVAKDAYNHFLYGWLIEQMHPFAYHYGQENYPLQEIDARKKTWFKKLGKNLILSYERLLPHRFNQYVFISSYLSPFDQWGLQLSLGQWPSLFAPEVNGSTGQVNGSMRERLFLSMEGNAFEKLLFQIIPQQIPQAYVEDYPGLKEQAMAQYPSQPKTILTANDFYSNEGFKIWSACQTQQGTKLVGVQHGGLYGAALFNASEDHEIKVSDVFYTWGWDSKENAAIKPMPAAKLNQFRKGVAADPQGKILLTLGLMPRYSYHLYSVYLASTGALAYLQDQISFVKALNAQGRKDLLVRPFPQDFEWSQKERFNESFEGLEFDTVGRSFIESLKTSRLCIATYNSTTYLETFVADFPTIIFWNPRHWEIRPSEQEYFDELRSAGILHDTPESVAQKVNAIYSDPMAWWQTKSVQDAKNKFCDRFAKKSDHWLQEWRHELQQLVVGKE